MEPVRLLSVRSSEYLGGFSVSCVGDDFRQLVKTAVWQGMKGDGGVSRGGLLDITNLRTR